MKHRACRIHLVVQPVVMLGPRIERCVSQRVGLRPCGTCSISRHLAGVCHSAAPPYAGVLNIRMGFGCSNSTLKTPRLIVELSA